MNNDIDFWIQHLEPETPIMSLKIMIASKINRSLSDFHLRTRCSMIDESKTLIENDINAESVIYVERNFF